MTRVGVSLLFGMILWAGFAPAATEVEIDLFEVRQKGGGVEITWRARNEGGIVGYELYRRLPWETVYGSRPLSDNVIPARGAGVLYTFNDNSVYKQAQSEDIAYQLKAVRKDAVREVVREKTAQYVSTAARRTWGSIKAMFQ